MITNKVKEARELKGLSQRELAELVGTGKATICDIEKDKHLPSIILGIKIAKALDTTAENLFWESEKA